MNSRRITRIASWAVCVALLALFLTSCATHPANSGPLDFLLIPVGIVAVVIIGLLLFIIPIEILFLTGIVFGILAASFLAEDATFYYLRFVPSVVITIRAYFHVTTLRPESVNLPTAVLVPFGLLALLALVSVLYSSNPGLSAQRDVSLLLALIVFGVALPVFLAKKPQRLRRLVLLSSLVVSLAVLLGILEFSGTDYTTPFSYNRAAGIFENPNTLGMVAMIGFFPLLGYWFDTRGTERIAVTGLLAMILFAILLSGSRASLLGIAVGLASMMLFANLNKTSRYRILTVLAVTLVLISALFLNNDLLSRSLGRTDDSGRLTILEAFIAYGMESPVIGHGFNAFTGGEGFEIYWGNTFRLANNPFNSYLLMFIGLGFSGLLFTVWGLVWVVKKGIQTLAVLPNPWFYLALLGGVVAGIVHAAFESWLFSFGHAATNPFWLMLTALCLYAQYPQIYSQAQPSDFPHTDRSPRRPHTYVR